jgi:SNF family Na+-dependent transporter
VGFGGMITIPAAFIFMGATGIIGQGTFGLGFNTLPVVFAQMPAGNVIGAIWFFMLFLAAITSSLSMLQPTIAFIDEALGCGRSKAVGITVAFAVAGSFFCLWFTGGTVGWGTIDDWVGTFLIVVLAFFQIVAFGWCFGVDRGLAEAHEGAHLRIPGFMRFIIKYVAPLYLLVAIVMFCKNDLPGWIGKAFVEGHKDSKGVVDYSPVAAWSLGVIALTTIVLVVITRIGEKRWRAQGLDLDGEPPPDDGGPAAGVAR